jgi:hypothetical protein
VAEEPALDYLLNGQDAEEQHSRNTQKAQGSDEDAYGQRVVHVRMEEPGLAGCEPGAAEDICLGEDEPDLRER